MKILYILLAVVLVEIQSKKLQPQPNNVAEESTEIKAKSHKRQATKEIILYLTPSQIKALQSGDAEISSFLPEAYFADQEKDLKSEEIDLIYDIKNINSDRAVIPVHEHQEDDYEFIKTEEQQIETENQNSEYEVPLNKQAVLEKLQLQGPNQWNGKEFAIQRDAWVAYDSDSEKTHDESINEEFKEKWNKILELNRKQVKALSELRKSESSVQTEKPLLQLQYGTKYNDQRNAIDIEKLIRERHQYELNKQSALVQAEAIANSPPILIKEEVKITKHHPVPVFRRVKPLSAPSAVSDPEAFKNIPVPLIIKHTVLPRVEKKLGDENQITLSLTNEKTNLRQESSFIGHKIVPYSYDDNNEKLVGELPIYRTEKVTILRPA